MSSLQAKKELMIWLTKRLPYVDTSHENLVNFILANQTALQNVAVVKQAEVTPRGLVLKSSTQGYHFVLYIQGQEFTDSTQIFHELNLNINSKLYLSLDLLETDQLPAPLKIKVYERNPFLSYEEQIGCQLRDRINESLTNFRYEQQEKILLNEIDEALKAHDQQRFEELSDEYQVLLRMKEFNCDE